jgi:uncharacterized membrane protein
VRRRATWILGTLLVAEAALLAIPGAVDVVGLRPAFRYVCHQNPERSLRVAGQLMPVCARCTGLHLGLILACLAVLILGRAPRAAWRWLALGLGALVMTTTVLVESRLGIPVGPMARLASGLALGVPVGVVLGRAATSLK